MGEKDVITALKDAGYKNLKAFLLKHSGYTLTEMAGILGVDVGSFVAYHNKWASTRAPDPLERQ